MGDVRSTRAGDPSSVGVYRLVGRLGEGAQGTVFLGQGSDGAHVAIKLLHPHLIDHVVACERFVREVQIATSVARFCTAQVLSAGLAEDRPYIVSEYVPGVTLEQSVRDGGPRTGAALERLAINTATALAAIHRAGVLHRDFKPANVLLGPDGPVVIDFGIARALDRGLGSTTRPGQIIGTPSYMAPEQISAGEVGAPADVFAWAGSMVFAASGRPAFTAPSLPAIFRKILEEEPDLGPLRGPLRELAMACLAKDPAQRPTADQLVHRLTGITGDPVSESPGGAVPSDVTVPRPRRRRAWGIPLAAAGGVAALVAVPVFVLLDRPGTGTWPGAAPSAASTGLAQVGPSPTARSAASVSPSGIPANSATLGAPATPSPGRSGSATPESPRPAATGRPTPQLIGADLMVNGDFEKGSLASWSSKAATLVRAGRHSGSFAARLRSVPGQGAAVEQQIKGLHPNSVYTLIGWVRSDGTQTFIGAKNYGVGAGTYRPATSGGYVRLSTTFTTGPSATSALVFCWREGTGTGYCDDLSLHASR